MQTAYISPAQERAQSIAALTQQSSDLYLEIDRLRIQCVADAVSHLDLALAYLAPTFKHDERNELRELRNRLAAK